MKLFFDLFPILLFFIAYKFRGIYAATAAAMLASVVQIAWAYGRHRKVEPMLWVSLAVITVFGGATLVLRDPTFIKWKPTVLYWIFSAVLFASATMFKKNLIATLMHGKLSLPDTVWRYVNLGWVGFFALLGALNLFVAYRYAESVWVNFKLFGTTGLLLAFALVQGLFLSRYVEDHDEG